MLQPQAPELEETILGACLIEKEGMALVDELLKPELFYVTRVRTSTSSPPPKSCASAESWTMPEGRSTSPN